MMQVKRKGRRVYVETDPDDDLHFIHEHPDSATAAEHERRIREALAWRWADGLKVGRVMHPDEHRLRPDPRKR